MPDPDGPVWRLDPVTNGPGQAGQRPGIGADKDRLAAGYDDEDARVPGGPALGGDDRIPLTRARDPGDPGLDPAERAGIGDVAAQDSWGSMSP